MSAKSKQKLRKEHPEYNSFAHAKERCNNPNNHAYSYYGGRGILFKFKHWREIVKDIGPRPPNTSLDRINTNGHYEKGNIRWSTHLEQMKNIRFFKRTPALTRKINEIKKEGYSQRDIAFMLGISQRTVGRAINNAE